MGTCLFCGKSLALERDLEGHWQVICPWCSMRGPIGVTMKNAEDLYLKGIGNLDWLRVKWQRDWARFRAVDANGKLFEYEFKPVLNEWDTGWEAKKGRIGHVADLKGPDWKQSLEERPRIDTDVTTEYTEKS
jgi:hypothetical protein